MSATQATARFEFAQGSVVGRRRYLARKNNQDAYSIFAWPIEEQDFILLTADGSSSEDGEHSEVGAKIFVRIASVPILMHVAKSGPENGLKAAQEEILYNLTSFIGKLGGDPGLVMKDYFLFRCMGLVVTGGLATLFSVGGGFAVINGEHIPIRSQPKESLPFFAMGMIGNPASNFVIHSQIQEPLLNNFAIGTKGVRDLDDAAQKTIPDGNEKVGSISQYWENDAYFKDPNLLNERLIRISGGTLLGGTGHLMNDTTLIVGRRK